MKSKFEEIEKKMDQLCNKTLAKIVESKSNMKVALIEFVEEYNNLWNNIMELNKTERLDH